MNELKAAEETQGLLGKDALFNDDFLCPHSCWVSLQLWSVRMFTVQQKQTNLEVQPHWPSVFPQTWTQITNKASSQQRRRHWVHTGREVHSFSTVCRLSWIILWTRKSWDYSNHYYLDKSGSEIGLPRPSEAFRKYSELVVCDWNSGFQ